MKGKIPKDSDLLVHVLLFEIEIIFRIITRKLNPGYHG